MKRRSRKINLVLFLILIAISATFALTAQAGLKGRYDYRVRVVNVVDGDTFDGLTRDKIEIRYRIFGIDAPERRQEFGRESTEYLKELILGKRVYIKVQKKRDAYGRPVVWVYTRRGKDVGALMLKSGMAWHAKKFDTSRQYSDLEKHAQSNRLGLWKDSTAVAPWDYKRNRRKR